MKKDKKTLSLVHWIILLPILILVGSKVFKLLSIFPLIAFLIISDLFAGAQTPPSDAEMIEVFTKNRAVFEKLLTMMSDDDYEVVSMSPRWSRPEDIPKSRKKEYYSLFKKINVTQLQFYDGRASFEVWSLGWAGDGDYKKYKFKPANVENLVESLENLPLNQTDIVFYHRKIDENWYLAYDHWP